MAGARRILIIDDNIDLAENIAEILQLDGHFTDVAASAEEALPKAARADLDVVVTDYRLPGITGVALVMQFRRMGRNLRAVVISAYTDDSTIKEARDAGALFMAKPVDYKLLARVVREDAA